MYIIRPSTGGSRPRLTLSAITLITDVHNILAIGPTTPSSRHYASVTREAADPNMYPRTRARPSWWVRNP